MKVTNLDSTSALDATKGRKSPTRAGSRGITFSDAFGTEAHPVFELLVLGGTITDFDDGTATLTIDASGGAVDAGEVTFDPTGLDNTDATDLQEAIADLDGAFLTKIEGGQDTIAAHGNMGSTETFDPTAGNVHTGTLNANCTFTLSAPVGSGAATLVLWITGSGTRTWTWPGSVTWDGGVTGDPPADTETVRVILETLDGGTTWIANMIGGGGGAASAITFDPTGLDNTSATNVQDAMEDFDAAITAGGGGAALVNGTVRSTSDITTTSTTLVDLTGMTLTRTTGARRVLVTFNVSAWNSTADTESFALLIDGGSVGLLCVVSTGASGSAISTSGFSYLTDVLSAASHVFKVQWKVGSGTGHVDGTIAATTFSVMEQPA